MKYFDQICIQSNIAPNSVKAVIDLHEEKCTVPFIARYRKERTGNLDEVQIRQVIDLFEYFTELEERKETVLKSIEEQKKLTPELKKQIDVCISKQKLEDIYLPFKPKRITRAKKAIDLGLEPLADLISSGENYTAWLDEFLVSKELSADQAISGAKDILAERISEDADLKEELREISWGSSAIVSKVRKEFENEKTKFDQYYEFKEEVRKIPAHRVLAIRRGEQEKVLTSSIEFPEEEMLSVIERKYPSSNPEFNNIFLDLREDSFKRLIKPSLEIDLRLKLKSAADEDSIEIFSDNLKKLLLAPLGGDKIVLGLDPGFRTGTKLVVTDKTGKLLHYETIFPVEPQNEVNKTRRTLQRIFEKYSFEVVCIGNGTASREVESFVKDFFKSDERMKIIPIVIVNESGASVYSASEEARREFPDLDVSYRGAVSIARRFQDPLAELVKIDPKSIGVGQYQHDVNQRKLKKSLDETVESCVNFVGVNLNTASESLLSYVSGISKTLAGSIVDWRNQNGSFQEKKDLLSVGRFGEKTFEQAAGFLRIIGGSNPLDRSAVHPENYSFVKKLCKNKDVEMKQLLGDESLVGQFKYDDFKEEIGKPTFDDILSELKKPGRDPRKEYKSAKFLESIQKVSDLYSGLKLEGVITNITHFGVFVDIGVHQDGLVHVSEISDQFVSKPAEVCSVGDIVKVTVLEINTDSKGNHRISLSMKSNPATAQKPKNKAKQQTVKKEKKLSGNFENDLAALAAKFAGR